MNERDLHFAVTRLLHREAHHLDRREWDAWLACFTDDVVVWAPAWANETELTSDPAREISMLYLRGKGALQDRVFRIETGDSFSSTPLDRSVHVIGNVLVHGEHAGLVEASASWITHTYGLRGAWTLGGLYEYQLRRAGDALLVAHKKIILIDDRLEHPVDLIHL